MSSVAIIPMNDPTAPTPVPDVRLLRFVGTISWEGRSNGLPEQIFDFVSYDGRAPQQVIVKLVEDMLARYRHIGGMAVQREQGKPIDPNATIADRVLVPYVWIVHIHPEFWPIPGPAISLPDGEGIERYPDGKEASVN